MRPFGWSWIAAGLLALAVGCHRADRRPTAPAAREDVAEDASPEPPTPNGQPGTAKGLDSQPGHVELTPAVPAAIHSHGKGSNQKEANAIFEKPTLLRIQIEIPPAGISILSGTHWEGGQDRPNVKVIVREGGMVYRDVALHLKGSAGSFQSIDRKPAMTLKFEKFITNQSFHGLHKISLNNSVQDSTYMSEQISRELFLAAGVPTPRASHATVELNGRALGLYVVLEGANKQFLKRYFENPKGNLYDGGFCGDIRSRLVVNGGADPNNNSGLRALRAALQRPTYAKLEKVLDTDRFLSMVALEWILCHWDGYSFNKNNWRVYHDLDSNRMVFIPHGLDQLLGSGHQFESLDGPFASAQGEVTRALLSTPEGQRLYRARVREIYTNVFKVDEIVARINEVATGVSTALAETDPDAARKFQRGANSFKHRIERRGQVIRQKLGFNSPPVEFGSNGVLPLTEWKPTVGPGEPVLREDHDAAGQTNLVINAGAGASTGSWRMRVVLDAGKYRFEGRVRVRGVTIANGDTRSGAGLRESKGAMPHKLSGTSDWQRFNYNFEVKDQGTDVELICELKATAGEAAFDLASLRLVRPQ